MDKKDIYEHLAKIYLDTPLRRPQVTRPPSPPKNSKKLVVSMVAVSVIAIVAVLIAIIAFASRTKGFARNSSLSNLLLTEAVKVNFNFNPAKKASYSFDLKNMNLVAYKALEFSVRKANPRDTLALRVEFTSIFDEKAQVYLKDVGPRWRQYTIALSEFKGISDWSQMKSLSFIAEEWNTTGKEGAFYIDNVRFLK